MIAKKGQRSRKLLRNHHGRPSNQVLARRLSEQRTAFVRGSQTFVPLLDMVVGALQFNLRSSAHEVATSCGDTESAEFRVAQARHVERMWISDQLAHLLAGANQAFRSTLAEYDQRIAELRHGRDKASRREADGEYVEEPTSTASQLEAAQD